jgi:hypothetical protein
MTFTHTTLPAMRRHIRAAYRQETGLRRLKAAKWLTENCTNAQLQNVFNLATPAEATALRTRLDAHVVRLSTWMTQQEQLAAVGGE